jgi:non-ribosomal peptide synthetase component F
MRLLGGQSDVLTGVVTNCRLEESDGERALGLFLNTVPLRQSLTGGSWLDLVRETFAAEREMLPHRWFPLAEMQRRLGGRHLFEAVFNFVHFHVYESVSGYAEMQPGRLQPRRPRAARRPRTALRRGATERRAGRGHLRLLREGA